MATIRTFINSVSNNKENIQSLLRNHVNTNNLFSELIFQNNQFLSYSIHNQKPNFPLALDKSPIQQFIDNHGSLNKLIGLLIESPSSKVEYSAGNKTGNQQIIISQTVKTLTDKLHPSKRSAQKQQRSSDLHGFLKENYLIYKPKSPEEFWKILYKTKDEEDSILQSIDSWSLRKPRIYWISSYGNEQSIGKRSFQNFFYKKLKKLHC